MESVKENWQPRSKEVLRLPFFGYDGNPDHLKGFAWICTLVPSIRRTMEHSIKSVI